MFSSQTIGQSPFLWKRLAWQTLVGLVALHALTRSAKGSSDLGFSWFLYGLFIGGPILASLLAIWDIRYFKRRMVSSTVHLSVKRFGYVFTPGLIAIIFLGLQWLILSVFSIPRETFGEKSLLIQTHRFLEGMLAITLLLSTLIQLVWVAFNRFKHGESLLLEYSDTNNIDKNVKPPSLN